MTKQEKVIYQALTYQAAEYWNSLSIDFKANKFLSIIQAKLKTLFEHFSSF